MKIAPHSYRFTLALKGDRSTEFRRENGVGSDRPHTTERQRENQQRSPSTSIALALASPMGDRPFTAVDCSFLVSRLIIVGR
jgi:hypothetical protein